MEELWGARHLLDNSGSMSGQRIEQLNEGLQAFRDELNADSLAAKRVEVGIVTFGPVQVAAEFTSASMFYPPVLEPQGATPMGQAIERGIEMLRARKESYKANGVSYYPPICRGTASRLRDHAIRRARPDSAGRPRLSLA